MDDYIETWNENLKFVSTDEARCELLSKIYDEGFQDGFDESLNKNGISDSQFDKSWVKEQWVKYCERKEHKKLNVVEFTTECLNKMREVANGNI